MRFRMNHVTVHAAILMLSAACIPYTVATTPLPVNRGEFVPSLSGTVMPELGFDSTRATPFMSFNAEVRVGIDSASDWGIRLIDASGIVLNYKRLLTRRDAPVLAAIIVGGGFVNVGNHAYLEQTLLVSLQEHPESFQVLPYAGLRAMQVRPIDLGLVFVEPTRDKPTVGGLAGVRLGRPTLGVSVEVGVFHDPSALDVRPNDIVVVPAIVVHGRELIEALAIPLRVLRPR